jgi:hypothetical protein
MGSNVSPQLPEGQLDFRAAELVKSFELDRELPKVLTTFATLKFYADRAVVTPLVPPNDRKSPRTVASKSKT